MRVESIDILNWIKWCWIQPFLVADTSTCLILDEYWQNHPELHEIPIYYASSLAKKCMSGIVLILLKEFEQISLNIVESPLNSSKNTSRWKSLMLQLNACWFSNSSYLCFMIFDYDFKLQWTFLTNLSHIVWSCNLKKIFKHHFLSYWSVQILLKHWQTLEKWKSRTEQVPLAITSLALTISWMPKPFNKSIF